MAGETTRVAGRRLGPGFLNKFPRSSHVSFGEVGDLVVLSVRADARLADWIVYFQAIRAVREWPLDAPTVGRFAAYLLLPVISWIGGALMERAINAVLEP